MERKPAPKLDEMAVKLLGLIAVKGLPQTQQIAVLTRIGFTPKDIADVLGTTPNTVRVALVGIRKAQKLSKRPIKFFGEEQTDD